MFPSDKMVSLVILSIFFVIILNILNFLIHNQSPPCVEQIYSIFFSIFNSSCLPYTAFTWYSATLLVHDVSLAKLFSIISSLSCPSPSVNLIYAQSSCPSHVSVRPARSGINFNPREEIFAHFCSSQRQLCTISVIVDTNTPYQGHRHHKTTSSVSSSSQQIHLIRTIVWHHFFISKTLKTSHSTKSCVETPQLAELEKDYEKQRDILKNWGNRLRPHLVEPARL